MLKFCDIILCHNINFWRFLVCRAYQMMTKKNWIFSIFIAFLNSLGQEKYIAQKRKKHAQKYVLSLSLKHLKLFLTCLYVLCFGVGVITFNSIIMKWIFCNQDNWLVNNHYHFKRSIQTMEVTSQNYKETFDFSYTGTKSKRITAWLQNIKPPLCHRVNSFPKPSQKWQNMGLFTMARRPLTCLDECHLIDDKVFNIQAIITPELCTFLSNNPSIHMQKINLILKD